MVHDEEMYGYRETGHLIVRLHHACGCDGNETLRVKVVAKKVLPWLVRHAACVITRFARPRRSSSIV